ncbi:MAG: cytochrome bd-I ubiquinol oxidase subunit CydA, partial [Pseudomonas formosensis]|nr:cytochrome bd-I ubiquinol oxidase subunit CydA [Halopseudomonas formosensis]
NPVAQVKFVHTVSAGYVTGAVFVLAISSWYLLKGRDLAFARRSFAIASAFGLAAALSVIVLGDESGYALGGVQKVKLAAIEAEWETHPAPAAFTLFGFPNQETRSTDYAVRIPAIMGLIATRSTDQQVDGFDRILEHNLQRIIRGQEAYQLMTRIRAGEGDEQVRARFEALRDDLGYGLLLSVYAEDVANASDAEIAAALDASIPRVWPLFWTFRIMVACGFLMLVIFAFAFWHSARRTPDKPRWLLRLALFSLPLPWIASEAGWFVAEYGRQPWAIGEILPTSLAVSSLTAGEVLGTLAAIVVLYSIFLIIEVWLMVRFARKGPSSLHTGRYDLETGKLKEA